MPTVASLQDFNYTSFDTNEILFPNKLNSRFGTVSRHINELIDVAEWLEGNSAGSSAAQPDTVRGRLWADTSNSGRVVLKLDPDGLGADDEVSTRLEGYRIGFANAGTDTHGAIGAIDIDTAQVSASADGQLISYSVPADTLSANSQIIKGITLGSGTNGASNPTITWRYGGASLGACTITSGAASIPWFTKVYIIRTSATACKWMTMHKPHRDDITPPATGGYVQNGTQAITMSSANTLDTYASADTWSGGTRNAEAMVTEVNH